MNRGTGLRRYLRISGNMMIRVRQQGCRRIAVKKPPMIRVDRGLQQVREQPTDHPDTRRKHYLPNLNPTVNKLAVQHPTDSPYPCADHRVLPCVRHPLVPLYRTATTAQLQLNWLSPFALLFCHCSG